MCKTGLGSFPQVLPIATSCGSVSRANASEGVTIIPHVTVGLGLMLVKV